jgi:hypothetical protein
LIRLRLTSGATQGVALDIEGQEGVRANYRQWIPEIRSQRSDPRLKIDQHYPNVLAGHYFLDINSRDLKHWPL